MKSAVVDRCGLRPDYSFSRIVRLGCEQVLGVESIGARLIEMLVARWH